MCVCLYMGAHLYSAPPSCGEPACSVERRSRMSGRPHAFGAHDVFVSLGGCVVAPAEALRLSASELISMALRKDDGHRSGSLWVACRRRAAGVVARPSTFASAIGVAWLSAPDPSDALVSRRWHRRPGSRKLLYSSLDAATGAGLRGS